MNSPEGRDYSGTWVASAYLICGSCGDKGYYPLSREWFWQHTGVWHSLKHWIKRKLHHE